MEATGEIPCDITGKVKGETAYIILIIRRNPWFMHCFHITTLFNVLHHYWWLIESTILQHLIDDSSLLIYSPLYLKECPYTTSSASIMKLPKYLPTHEAVHRGGAATFASAKVNNAIGRIGIFPFYDVMLSRCSKHSKLCHIFLVMALPFFLKQKKCPITKLIAYSESSSYSNAFRGVILICGTSISKDMHVYI